MAPPVTSSNIVKTANPIILATVDAPHPHTYVVQPGDKIYAIARRYGVKAATVLALNPNVSPTHLRPGQSLNLP